MLQTTSPFFFVWRSLRMSAKPLFHSRSGDACRDVALQEQEHDRDGCQAEEGHGEDIVPLHRELALKGVQPHLQREILTAAEND